MSQKKCRVLTRTQNLRPIAGAALDRYLLLDRDFNTVLCEDPSCAEHLLGAAPTKAAALITFLPLAAAALLALLVTGTSGSSAWRSRQGDRGQGRRLRSNVMGCLAGVEASDQAAVELQVSFALLL